MCGELSVDVFELFTTDLINCNDVGNRLTAHKSSEPIYFVIVYVSSVKTSITICHVSASMIPPSLSVDR
jgi:hypothetical protein